MRTVKNNERVFLDLLIEGLPELHGVEVQDHESPDFLLRGTIGLVGVEVTQYATSDSQGASAAFEQSSLRARTVTFARRLYERGGGAPRYVDIAFADYPPLTKERAPRLGAEIADALLALTPKIAWYEEGHAISGFATQRFPEVATIHAVSVADREAANWVTHGGGLAWHVQREDVEPLVAKKETLLAKYLQSCPTVWLLIGFDIYAAGDTIRPPMAPVQFYIKSAFRRVLCVSRVSRQIVEVPVSGLAE